MNENNNPKDPTLADIYQFMGTINQKIDGHTDELLAIKAQTTKTNGRVTKLERRNEVADGVIAWQEKHEVPKVIPTAILDNDPPKDLWKVILALVGIMGGVVTLLTILANKM